MATQTKQERINNKKDALDLLIAHRKHVLAGGLFLITQEQGKGLTDYLRVSLVYQGKDGETMRSNLTWSVAKALGYSLRDRSGYWYLPISGYGYSKADEVARSLASFYGVDRIRYELN
jgi:hypothetical protein